MNRAAHFFARTKQLGASGVIVVQNKSYKALFEVMSVDKCDYCISCSDTIVVETNLFWWFDSNEGKQSEMRTEGRHQRTIVLPTICNYRIYTAHSKQNSGTSHQKKTQQAIRTNLETSVFRESGSARFFFFPPVVLTIVV